MYVGFSCFRLIMYFTLSTYHFYNSFVHFSAVFFISILKDSTLFLYTHEVESSWIKFWMDLSFELFQYILQNS